MIFNERHLRRVLSSYVDYYQLDWQSGAEPIAARLGGDGACERGGGLCRAASPSRSLSAAEPIDRVLNPFSV